MCAASSPTRLFHNGRIWTGTAKHAWADSVLIENGSVVTVDPPQAAVPAQCEFVDLHGGFLIPGLVDSHLHLTLGSAALSELDLSKCATRAEFESRVASRHAELPPDAWLVAHSWNEADWNGAAPTLTWLASSADRPAVAWRMDRHACVVNRAALALIALPNSIDGGRIERDSHGAPTGLLQEAAAWRLVIPRIPPLSTSRAREALLRGAHSLRRQGVVAVGSMEYLRDLLNVHISVRAELPIRVHATVLDRDWPIDAALEAAKGIPSCARLRIIGMKAFIDGTLGSRTAAMLAPYSDDAENAGILVELAQGGHLHAWLELVRRAGLSPSMHAIGDRAARLALDAADAAAAAFTEQECATAPRFEHMQTMHEDDIPRMRGRFASMQPLHKADDARGVLTRLGAARLKRFFPFRSLLRAGATLAFGSDWPIVSSDPLLGMRAAITGIDLDGTAFETAQNVSVEEALWAYTRDACRMLSLPGGLIAPGYAADFTLLDADPFAWNWHAGTPSVLATFVDGV